MRGSDFEFDGINFLLQSLQSKMRGSDFEFDGINFLYYGFNKNKFK